MIIDDRGQKAQSQLKKIAQDEGLALPTALTPEQQGDYEAVEAAGAGSSTTRS